MKKILTIAWKDVFVTFTDKSLIVIMILTPLLISTIVAMVFGGDVEGGVSFSNIPVAVVNLDKGADVQGETVNYGQILTGILIPSEAPEESEGGLTAEPCPLVPDSNGTTETGYSLEGLVKAVKLADPNAAREGVEKGEYAAAVIIPAGFSAALTPNQDFSDTEESIAAQIEVFGDHGRSISASVISSIVSAFTDQMLTGNIAITASLDVLGRFNPDTGEVETESRPLRLLPLNFNAEASSVLGCGFSDTLNTLTITHQPIDDTTKTLSGFATILLQIGAAQTVFFGLFTGQFGILSIIEERRAQTLQRMLVSPTSRFEILAGKLAGTFVTVIFQLVVMMLALTLVASLIDNAFLIIWGTKYALIIAVVLALSLAVCGISMLVAGIVNTPEQAGAFGSVINIILAMFGGAFGAPLPSPFRETSLVYWGVDALNKLSQGNTAIALNVAVLAMQGVVFFMIGWWLFSRRLDV